MDFQNESVIVEGKAKKIKGNKRIEGILFLTNTNIIFDAKDLEISVLNLKKIESVNLFCVYGLLNRGIVIKRAEGEADHFILKYAKDWKRIIDCSIQEAISKNY